MQFKGKERKLHGGCQPVRLGNFTGHSVHLRIYNLKHSPVPISIYRAHIDLVSKTTLYNFLCRYTALSDRKAFRAGGSSCRCLYEDDLPVARVTCVAIRDSKSGTRRAVVERRAGEEAGGSQTLRGCEIFCCQVAN